MRRILSLCCAAALVLSLACSDDDTNTNNGKKDGGTVADKAIVQADQGKIDPINCSTNTCHDFVANKLLLPTDSTESQKYAMQFNGKPYNSLGGILALIASQASDLKIQEEMDGALCEGAALILMRAEAKDLTAGDTTLQTWVAKKKACCTTTSDNKTCCTEADKACFNGTTEFEKSVSKEEYLFKGKIAGGKLTAGPSKMKLNLTLSGGAALALNLKYVQIKGDITATGIKNGVLSGAIPKDDLDNVIVPQIATMVNTAYTDPKGDKKTKDLLKTLFDTNKDGKITAAEVKGNGLIKTFLDGDVDVDGDGKKELSLGLGFTTVKAKIKD